ncbi:MAG: ThuA domain-containing protein, partial [Phycisphaerales bacterium]
RSWYTGGGHTKESYSEPLFRQHIEGGILWAAAAPEAKEPPRDAKPLEGAPKAISTQP